MKKNNFKLIAAAVLTVLMLVTAVLAQHGLRDQLKLDGQFAGGTELTYQIDSTDAATVRKAADVLTKRFYNAGATAVETEINGSNVILKVSGIEDFTPLRGLVTRTGKLTFRNTADELLMDASVLDSKLPVTVSTANDLVYVNLNVKDGTLFGEKTGELAKTEDSMMVLWVDFEEGTDSYKTESAAENPSFLGAATVTSAISSSCYITVHHTYEEARNMAIIINSGELPAGAVEVSLIAYGAENGPAALNTAWILFWVGVILSAAGLSVLYGFPGFITGTVAIAFASVTLRFATMAGAVFNSSTLAAVAVNLAVGIYLCCIIYEKFRNELLKGRNINASFKTAMDAFKAQLWETPLLMGITSAIAYLLFADTLGQTAIVCGIGAAAIFVLFSLLNRIMVKSLIESNIVTNKERYGVKLSEIPDVEKGESYQGSENRMPEGLVNAVKGNAVLYAACTLAVAGLAFGLFSGYFKTAIAGLLITLCIAVILAEIYGRIMYRRQKSGTWLVTVTAGTGIAMLVTALLKGTVSLPLAVLTGTLGVLAPVLAEIRVRIRNLSREKINDSKLSSFVGGILTDMSGRSLIAPLAASVLAFSSLKGGLMTCILQVVVLFVTAALAICLGCRQLKNSAVKGPKKKAKKTTGLKENTIFGINEIK